MRDHQAPFDPRALCDALGAFVTGVTVITTQDEGEASRRMQAAALKIERQLAFFHAPQPSGENTP
jgi:hypothetical protein